MKNLWPEKFEENTMRPAKLILEEQAELLAKITGGIVTAEVTAVAWSEGHNRLLKALDMTFRFDIIGKFLDYRFSVLWFGHDIPLYPVRIYLDEDISTELGLESAGPLGSCRSEVEGPDELEAFVERVFKSARLGKVIGSILRLSH